MGSLIGRQLMNATYYNESSDEESDTSYGPATSYDSEYEQTFNRPNIINESEPEKDRDIGALDAILELAESKLNEGDYVTIAKHAKTLFNQLQPNKQRTIIDTNRVLSRRLLNRSPNIVFELTYAEIDVC